MKRAIITAFHKYTPFGGEYYEPILDFYLTNMRQFQNEYDHIYLVDSNWNIQPDKLADTKASVIKVGPHLRYYDAYKEVLPQVKEDLVLFMDNDMVVYKPLQIDYAFRLIDEYLAIPYIPRDVVSIYAIIGDYKTNKLNGKNKFCPFFFATRKKLLMRYLGVDWGPNMPEYETLGKLTQAMLEDGAIPCEYEEDYSKCLTDNCKGKSKDLGYYHIQAGSTPAYLLAAKSSKEHNKTYWEYLKNQPKSEYLRQCFWYDYMSRKTTEGVWKMTDRGMDFCLMLKDMGVELEKWEDYYNKCMEYHGL